MSQQTSGQAAGAAEGQAHTGPNPGTGEFRYQARNLFDEASAQARTGQRKTADGLRALAAELHEMADGRHYRGPAADLVAQAAGHLNAAADWLDRSEPGDLLHEVHDLARRHPGTFIIGAALAGLVAGRLTRGGETRRAVDSRAGQSDRPGGPVAGSGTGGWPAGPAAAGPPGASGAPPAWARGAGDRPPAAAGQAPDGFGRSDRPSPTGAHAGAGFEMPPQRAVPPPAQPRHPPGEQHPPAGAPLYGTAAHGTAAHGYPMPPRPRPAPTGQSAPHRSWLPPSPQAPQPGSRPVSQAPQQAAPDTAAPPVAERSAPSGATTVGEYVQQRERGERPPT